MSALTTASASTLPVIIGAAVASGAQSTSEAQHDPSDPIELMAEALRLAVADTDAPGLLDAIQLTAVVGGLWRYRNPAALVAAQVGVRPGRTLLTEFGGQTPIGLFADLAERIQRGQLDVAVILGGECNATRRAQTRTDQRPTARPEVTDPPDEHWGEALVVSDEIGAARGGDQPRTTYAILDSAIRAARGESLDEARDRAARISASFAAVAVRNPHSATRQAMSVAEIREPSATNRMVSWPYTKAMCANNTVDHAGAIILCSQSAADRMGVPTGKRVHAIACSAGADTSTLDERIDLAVAPGLRQACDALVEVAGSIRDIAYLDLYCCFPSMVTLTADALGIDLGRALTVGGGLGMAGAPMNFAAGEGLIAMVHQLRADSGSLGLVQGNGGHASKHALGLFSTRAPDAPFRVLRPLKNAVARPTAPAEAVGPAVVDGVTVEYDSAGPQRAVALVRFDDGSRTWANSDDVDVMRDITESEWVGRLVRVDAGRLSPR